MLKAKLTSKLSSKPAATVAGKTPSMGVSTVSPTADVAPAKLPTADIVGGETVIVKPTVKPEPGVSVAGSAPVPIFKLATEIFPSKSGMFSSDAQLEERFNLVATALENEAEISSGSWAGQVILIHQRVKADPELVTALSDTALRLYFEASSRLANTAAGVAISKRLVAKRQADSLAKAQATAAEMATKAALVGDDLEWED